MSSVSLLKTFAAIVLPHLILAAALCAADLSEQKLLVTSLRTGDTYVFVAIRSPETCSTLRVRRRPRIGIFAGSRAATPEMLCFEVSVRCRLSNRVHRGLSV